MITICPRCNRRIIVEEHIIDFIHECDSKVAAIDNEDIQIIGDWIDYTGSGTVNNVLLQGATNKLFGTRADLEREDLDPMTLRGKSALTHRTRKHHEFINLKGGT